MTSRRIPAFLAVLFLAVLLLAAALPVGAQTQAPAAQTQPATAATNNVTRWAPGAGTVTVGKDELKVLSAGDIKVAVTLVDLWKETTAARLQITNLGGEPLATAPDAFTLEVVKPKPQSLNPIPGEKLSHDIKVRVDHEAEMSGQQAMHYASANGSGEKDEAARVRLEGDQKADYIKDSALPPSLQPRFQTIGHVYFPYLKKRDEVVLRVTIGGATYEFPFEKAEIHSVGQQ
jgi:hypothetical protein